MSKDGDDNFRFNERRACEIAWIRGDVLYHDSLFVGGSESAKAFVQRNANVRGEAPGVRADDEEARVGGINEIKARPVVARHFFMNTSGDALHEDLCRDGFSRERFKLCEQFSVNGKHWTLSVPKRLRECRRRAMKRVTIL